MSEADRPIPPPRARPVAELPLDALQARADELARRWAIALILARPLEGIGGVPLEELAHDAPALCEQTIRALHSELELDRLTASGAQRTAPARALGAISGAGDAPGLVGAVEALRGVLWEALLEEPRPAPYGEAGSRQLADLGDRLAYVCARMLLAALEAGAGAGEAREPGGQAPPAVGRERTGPAAETTRAVIVDERAPATRPQAGAQGDPAASGEGANSAPVEGADSAPVRLQDTARAEIEIRDARGAEGPAAWISSIGRQLERLREDGLPFAVLLVEPMEAESLRRAEPPREMLRVSAELEDALTVALRRTPGRAGEGEQREPAAAPGRASLTRERAGRYWVLAPQTDREGAARLAERLRAAVASVVESHGAPLEIVIGIAVCPEDGMQSPALAAHADIDLYAARSARVRSHPRARVDGRA